MKKLYLLFFISFFCGNIFAQNFTDPNFSLTTISDGWNQALGAAFSKDAQKLFVWEKAGLVYVCNKSGNTYTRQTTPVINLSAEVLNWMDHGLLGFALDPDYLSNGYIYLLYVVDRRVLMNDNSIVADAGFAATIGRVTRYKTILSGSNLVIDPSSRTILLGETKSTGIPLIHESHGLGTLAFAADGTLLITAGDAANFNGEDYGSNSETYYAQALADGIIRPQENVGAFRAQLLNSHNGKLLRIDPGTGNGVVSNPFYSAAEPRSAKSRVWSFGLRNPFRFIVRPGTGSTNPLTGDIGEIFIADVGWEGWEDFNIATGAGQNFGWPIYEGQDINSRYTTYAATTQNGDEPNPLAGGGCPRPFFTFRELIKDPTPDGNATINNPCNASVVIGTGNRYVHRRPSLDYGHQQNNSRVGIFSGNNPSVAEIGTPASGVAGTPFRGYCAVAGMWYTGNDFPPQYKDKFFMADWASGWIKRISVDFTDVVTRVDNFVDDMDEIVCMVENPVDGTVVVVAGWPHVMILDYGGNQPPVAKPVANITYGSSPLTVNFTGNTSYDLSPGGSIVSYSWNFGGGVPATSNVANPGNVVFTDASGNPQKFVAKLTVTDNGGVTHTDSVIISVNNTPPVVNITSPINNSTYKPGSDTTYLCTANVTDNEHGPAQLKYEWQTFLRHNIHEHAGVIDNNVNTATTISRIGCNGDTYYWFIKLKVTDAAGLFAIDSAKLFPDCIIGPDITPPTVSSVSPVNGVMGINTGATVAAIFNEAIDASTVNGTTFQLKDAANNIIGASVQTSANQIILTPSAALTASTAYTAKIKGGASGVEDLAGNALVSDYTWSFTSASSDNTPPTVTSVSPLDGATGVSVNTTVTASFSEAVDGATVTGTTFQLKDAGNNVIPAGINTVSNQIILTPSAPLGNSAVYTVTITGGDSGVKDPAGNALADDFNWTFITAAPVDNTPPTVSTVSPLNGATGVSINTTVTANFSEAVNGTTVTGTTFQLKAGSTVIPATVNTASNQITLTPTSALANSTTYTVTIKGGGAGIKDPAGNALVNDFTWTFTTAAVVDNTPPTVSTVSPLNGATGVSINTTVTASFSEAVNGTTVTGTTFQLKAGSTVIPATVNTASNQITLTPTTALENSTTYTVTIKGGGAGVKDLAANALVNDFTWTFATASPVDNTPPTVLSVIPTNGSTGVSVNTTVTANFSEAVNGTTVTGTTFQLKAGSTVIPATVNTASNQITLTPTTALVHSTIYTVTIKGGGTGVKDPAGNALVSDYNWSFTTAAAVDNTPPTVLTVSPLNGATGVNISTTVTADFSEAINGATVTGTTFQLKAGSTVIPATVNTASNQITLTPTGALANSTTYTVTIKGGASGVKDPAGNALVNDHSWSFTTIAAMGGTTANIFPPTDIPDSRSNDGQPISLGVKFRSLQNGFITGVRYYKAAGTTGTHTGQLWSNNGTLLAQATFINETATGWQQVLFTTPVAISAGVTYVASYHSPSGDFSATGSYFTQAVVNGPLRGLANGEDGVNGLYKYSATPAFPNNGYEASNYWADVVFTTSSGNEVAPTVTKHPVTQSKCAQTNVSLTSTATGTPAPTVQWQESTNGTTWTNIPGATNSTLTFVTAIADNGKKYRAVWTNGGGSVNTNAATLTVKPVPLPPVVTVLNNCGNSVLTAVSFTGTLMWSNRATTPSITVTTAGAYNVRQAVNGCVSLPSATKSAAPKATPALTSSLAATVTSGNSFFYSPTSTVAGTTFTWSRAAVSGISNASANAVSNISETLINTTGSPVNVTYVYTLNANGCTNTQHVIVTVNPEAVETGENCVINGSITSMFNNKTIPAGRYIWFSSAFQRGDFAGITGTVTFNVTNAKISFTANGQPYTLNVPDARIRYDAAVTSASTQFINNVWETAVPRNYANSGFMSGLSYLVPSNLPGSIANIEWTADINIDKPGVSLSWKWGAAVYTSFAGNEGLSIKPINISTQNPYPNFDIAGTPENFKSFLVPGARGNGGTSYVGNYTSISTATCTNANGQRSSGELVVLPVTNISIEQKLGVDVMPNPSNTFFDLVINSSNKTPVSVKVFDISGQVVERRERISSNSTLRIGKKLTSGSYVVEVVQGDQRKFIKIIKVN